MGVTMGFFHSFVLPKIFLLIMLNFPYPQAFIQDGPPSSLLGFQKCTGGSYPQPRRDALHQQVSDGAVGNFRPCFHIPPPIFHRTFDNIGRAIRESGVYADDFGPFFFRLSQIISSLGSKDRFSRVGSPEYDHFGI